MGTGGIDHYRKKQREFHRKRRSVRSVLGFIEVLTGVGMLLLVIGTAMVMTGPALLSEVVSRFYVDPMPCAIKGEITVADNRVYYLPDSRDYEKVTISARRGERWFCTEAAAREAGWQPTRP